MPPLEEIQEADSTAEIATPSSPTAAPNTDPDPAAAVAVEETKSTVGETFVELVAPGLSLAVYFMPRTAA